MWVRARATPSCPACLSSRVSYHSAYDRKLMDLPWQGRQGHLRLRTRRFRCRNTNCGRKIFAERLEGVAAPRARETCRLGEIVGVVGYVMGGLPGSRLLKRLGGARSRYHPAPCEGAPINSPARQCAGSRSRRLGLAQTTELRYPAHGPGAKQGYRPVAGPLRRELRALAPRASQDSLRCKLAEGLALIRRPSPGGWRRGPFRSGAFAATGDGIGRCSWKPSSGVCTSPGSGHTIRRDACRVAHPTTAETLSAASRISWDVLAVLSGGTSVAPVGAPVPGDAALAECR